MATLQVVTFAVFALSAAAQVAAEPQSRFAQPRAQTDGMRFRAMDRAQVGNRQRVLAVDLDATPATHRVHHHEVAASQRRSDGKGGAETVGMRGRIIQDQSAIDHVGFHPPA